MNFTPLRLPRVTLAARTVVLYRMKSEITLPILLVHKGKVVSEPCEGSLILPNALSEKSCIQSSLNSPTDY
jgi:hypothetical protein